LNKESHVLIIFPHPDDESFGTAGTITEYVSAGIPVTYVCMTLGEMGRNLGNPPFASREHLPAIRNKELDDACAILGINVIKMGFRDKTIEFLDENAVAEQILAIVEQIQPSLVISFYPPYAVHPDHNACGRIVINALRRMPVATRPKLHLLAFSNNCEQEIGPPNITRDIRPYAEKKIAAVRAHRSQSESMAINWDNIFKSTDAKTKKRYMTENFWEYSFE